MERHFIYKFMKFIDLPTNSPKVLFFKIHYDKTLKSEIKKNFKATEKIKFLSYSSQLSGPVSCVVHILSSLGAHLRE